MELKKQFKNEFLVYWRYTESGHLFPSLLRGNGFSLSVLGEQLSLLQEELHPTLHSVRLTARDV